MLAVSHAVIGATTGRFIESPFVAFFLNLAFHFPLDRIKHYLPEKMRDVYVLATVDTLLTIGFMFLLFFYGGDYKFQMLAGALGGVCIDFVLVLTPLLKTKIGEWHVSRQAHTSAKIYLIIDFTTLILFFIFWWNIK